VLHFSKIGQPMVAISVITDTGARRHGQREGWALTVPKML